MTDTNGLLRAPTNFWTTNIVGDGVTVIPTNASGGWKVILKATGGSGDPGGTNARQFGSLNLTNWSNVPTGAMANVTAANFLTNWANAVSNYVTSATNSPSVTNWIDSRQPASANLTNWSNVPTGQVATIYGANEEIQSNAGGTLWSTNKFFWDRLNGQAVVVNGGLGVNARGLGTSNDTSLAFYVNNGAKWQIGTSGNAHNLTPLSNNAYDFGSITLRPRNSYLKAIFSDGTANLDAANITNTLTVLSATASTVLSADASKNVTSIANGTGMLTNNGSGVVGYMAIPAGGGSVITNANQFGDTSNGEITIKSSATITNPVVYGTAGAATTLGINANASGGGPLIKAKDTVGADVFVVQVDGAIQGNGPGGGPLLIGPTTAGFVLTANASGYGSWTAPPSSATAGGFSGAIQFNEGTAIAGTNRFDWDRTNEVLNMNGIISATLSTPPSNSLAYFTANTNDYVQINIRNLNAGTGAESGYAATADNGTETAGFAWMGINSSVFSATRAYSIGGANDSVWIGSGNDMRVANANTNKDIIFSGGTAGTPFWQQRAIIKSTTRGGALGVTAGLSASNAWVAGKIIDVKGLTFTNYSATFSLTNAYTNATLIAANMLTNQGDTVICEWVIAHRKPATATNVFQVVYGSEIIFNSGLMNYSNGMSVVRQRITRGSSGTQQYCEGGVEPFQSIVSAIGRTNLTTSVQSNWIATPIGLRFSSSGAQLVTNVAFRMYYEPATL